MASTLMLKLVGDDSHRLRGMHTPDGLQVFSVFDFLTLACAKNDKGAYARKWFGDNVRDEKSLYYSEFNGHIYSLQFPGIGQRHTPCMTIPFLQRLLIIMGGKVAAEYRALVESTFTRVMAGDQSLIEVINANAASSASVQQAYRAALAQEPAASVLEEFCGVKRREREDLELDMALEERKCRLEESRLRLDETRLRLDESRIEKAMEHASRALGLMEEMKSRVNIDERTKLQFEDHIKNLILTPRASPLVAIMDASSQQSNETTALNVSVVAAELGYRKCTDSDLIKIGRAMAAKYRETYKRDPPKHRQYVKGNYIPVNSYMERDRPMMEQTIRQQMCTGNDTESDE